MIDADLGRSDRVAAFAAFLRDLARRENRGALAALRRSLLDAQGMASAACPYVVPFLPSNQNDERDRDFFLIGALFALHPEPDTSGTSLGSAFRRISEAEPGAKEGLQRRFAAILDAEAEDLPDHLRHAVSFLRAKQQPIDFEQLLRDLLGWSHPNRYVQRRLARDFWNVPYHFRSTEGAISNET